MSLVEAALVAERTRCKSLRLFSSTQVFPGCSRGSQRRGNPGWPVFEDTGRWSGTMWMWEIASGAGLGRFPSVLEGRLGHAEEGPKGDADIIALVSGLTQKNKPRFRTCA